MTADEATKLVESKLVDPLRKKKVTVTYDGVESSFSPEKLEVDSDVDGMVDKALKEEGQEGGLPTRVWRYATGGEVDVAISPQVTYSNEAIKQVVAEAPPRTSTPRPSTRRSSRPQYSPLSTASRATTGSRSVRASHADESVVQRTARRKVTVPVDTVEPEVSKQDLAAPYPTYLTVNRSTFELTLWKDLEPAKTYTVAIGAEGFDTPAGVYNIQNKAVDPASTCRTPTGPALWPARWFPAAPRTTR